MASKRWAPKATAVTQANTITPASVGVGNTFTITVNSKSVIFVATAATVANVTAGLVTALQASTEPEFLEISWSDQTTHIQALSTQAGRPFTQTSSATGGTATLTTTVVIASSGPNKWDAAANWSDNVVPITGDSVYIEDSDVSIKYGLDQSAVTLALLSVRASFTGEIGLAEVNQDAADYREYRSQYLSIGATLVDVGHGPGQGSGRVKLNQGTVATTVTVHGTGSSAEADLEAMQWKGTHASNIVNVLAGSVALAGYSTDLATVATLRIGHQGGVESDAEVRCGPGCTLTTIRQTGGELAINSAATTVTMDAGTLTVNGTGAVGTLTVDQGSITYRSTGTITTLTLGSDSGIDFSQDARPRTITNVVQMYGGSSLLDPNSTVTFSGGIRLNRCGLTEVTLDVGQNRLLTVT